LLRLVVAGVADPGLLSGTDLSEAGNNSKPTGNCSGRIEIIFQLSSCIKLTFHIGSAHLIA
jgi:hypothetical protein